MTITRYAALALTGDIIDVFGLLPPPATTDAATAAEDVTETKDVTEAEPKAPQK